MYLPQVLQVYWLTYTVYINICARTNNDNKNTAKSTMKYISAADNTTTFSIQLPYSLILQFVLGIVMNCISPANNTSTLVASVLSYTVCI